MLFKPTAAILLLVFAFANSGFSQLHKGSPADSLTKPIEKFNNSAQFGQEGIGMGARLRGTSILNISTRPLIVVDGIPYQNISTKDFDFTTADERDYAQLIGLAQEDIKDIVIEHNAVVTAQYGSRAAGGVILVSTKRGDTGKINVNYSYKNTLGVQPRGYDVLNGDDYIMLMHEELYNSFGGSSFIPEEISYVPSNGYLRYNYSNNTDWYKEIAQRSLAHDHNLSVSGGTKKMVYRLSVGYLNKEGTVKKTEQKQFTSRMDINYSILKNLNVSISLQYFNLTSYGSFQNSWNLPLNELALKKMPNASVYEYDIQGKITGQYFATTSDFQGVGYFNPVAQINLSHNNKNNNRFIPNFSILYTPIKQLSYLFNASYTLNNYDNEGAYSYKDWLYPEEYTETYDKKVNTYYTQNKIVFKPFTSSNHSLNLGASYQTFSMTSAYTYDKNKSVFGQGDFNAKSHFETINLNYLAFNKYLVDFCLRGESNSLTNDYSIDPAVSFIWHASNEKFLKKIGAINDLSFTASYGIITNPYYPEMSTPFSSIRYLYKNFNAGFNIALINRRVNLHLIYFSRVGETQNLIYTVDSVSYGGQIPMTYMSSSLVSGINSKNEGWEMNLQTSIVKRKDFSIDFSLNLHKSNIKYSGISSYRKVDFNSMAGNGLFFNAIENDKPVGSVYGYKYKGVYSDDAATNAKDVAGNILTDAQGIPIKMTYYDSQIGYTFQPGDAVYADLDYDGDINEKDVSEIANLDPVFTGSGGSSFRYKNIMLGIYFNFRYGNDIVNIARMEMENMYNYNNQSTAVMRRWRAPGQVTDVPRALYGQGYNWLGSTRFVEDGSFIRLKAITLKYDFDNSIVQKLYLNNLSCFVTCRNLFTLTNYKGADADIMLNNTWSENGYDYNYNAIKQEFTFGLNIGI